MTRNLNPYIQKCTDCIYCTLEREPPYWENPEEFNLGCNYPAIGTIELLDREAIKDQDWCEDVENAENCTEYAKFSS